MFADGDRDGDERSRHDFVLFWPCAPVNRPRRQVKQQIDDTRRLHVEQPGIKLRELGSDAREAGERGKQGVEQVGTHARSLSHLDFADIVPPPLYINPARPRPGFWRWSAHDRDDTFERRT